MWFWHVPAVGRVPVDGLQDERAAQVQSEGHEQNSKIISPRTIPHGERAQPVWKDGASATNTETGLFGRAEQRAKRGEGEFFSFAFFCRSRSEHEATGLRTFRPRLLLLRRAVVPSDDSEQIFSSYIHHRHEEERKKKYQRARAWVNPRRGIPGSCGDIQEQRRRRGWSRFSTGPPAGGDGGAAGSAGTAGGGESEGGDGREQLTQAGSSGSQTTQ